MSASTEVAGVRAGRVIESCVVIGEDQVSHQTRTGLG
jgi:hypothetical protein